MYRRLRTVWTRGFCKSHSEHHSATATTDVDSSILTTSHTTNIICRVSLFNINEPRLFCNKQVRLRLPTSAGNAALLELLCAVACCSNRPTPPSRRAHSSKPAARCCSGRMGHRRTDSASKVTTLRRYTNLFIIIIIIIITLTLTLPRATRAVSKTAV